MKKNIKKLLITGANGMLGSEATVFFSKHFEVIPATRSDFDVTNLEAGKEFVSLKKPDIILHTAAYTDVDGAESNSEKCFLINETGTENIAKISAELDIPIIYISTDYIFDGTKKTPYTVDDKPHPINIYGMSKHKGELAVQRENPKHYIVRTSWLYGKNGKNFVNTMLKLSKEHKRLKVVNDQIGSPTSVGALCDGILNTINDKPFGIYNVASEGYVSWYGFAKKIFELANIDIELIPCLSKDFPRPAKRPAFSATQTDNICKSWEFYLDQYLKK